MGLASHGNMPKRVKHGHFHICFHISSLLSSNFQLPFPNLHVFKFHIKYNACGFFSIFKFPTLNINYHMIYQSASFIGKLISGHTYTHRCMHMLLGSIYKYKSVSFHLLEIKSPFQASEQSLLVSFPNEEY